VDALLLDAPKWFHLIRLSTDTEVAAAFYLRNGFSSIEDSHATHIKYLHGDELPS